MITLPKSRRIGRLGLILTLAALAGSTAFVTWWTTTLTGLPDVGDPFDVEAFCRPIPDETNAFVLYKQAAALLPKEPDADAPANYDWATAPQSQRDWIEKSREAFAIWKKGSERPDAIHVNPSTITFNTTFDVVQGLRSLCRMALVEGSRMEGEGDYDRALDLYLAVLRTSRHCGQRGTFSERLFGVAIHRWVSARLIRWAADPKVDARLLRKALDAAKASKNATAPMSDSLKVEYLIMVHSFADPDLMVSLHDHEVVPDNQGGSTTKYGQHGWKAGPIRVARRTINEPERSLRVMRMVYANWLAYADLPPAQRPPKALTGSAQKPPVGSADALLSDLFAVGPDAPAQARALPPGKLARWFASTMDAKLAILPFGPVELSFARERSGFDAMLITLASELYKREHGHDPEKNEDLVGPYLDELPAGNTAPK